MCRHFAAVEAVAKELTEILRPEALVVSLQNGVRNPATLRAALGRDQIVLAERLFVMAWRSGTADKGHLKKVAQRVGRLAATRGEMRVALGRSRTAAGGAAYTPRALSAALAFFPAGAVSNALPSLEA